MANKNKTDIIEPVVCAVFAIAQIAATSPAGASQAPPAVNPSNWHTYTDPLYAYTLPVPSDWHIAPTPADVAIGVAVFTDYDPELAQQTGVFPDNALRVQIGIAPIAPDEAAATWLARWQASQAADDWSAQRHMGQPERMQIAGFEAFSYTVSAASAQRGIELGIRLAQDQMAVIGIIASGSS